jgi:hypothetical protein
MDKDLQMITDKDFPVMVSLLDQYKAAWINESQASKVADTKMALRQEVAEKFPTKVVEAQEYFDIQCLNIESRWNRPIAGHFVH